MILYRSHLADNIKHRHTHDSHSKEDVEHILLAHLFLMAGTSGIKMKDGKEPKPMKSAISIGRSLAAASMATRIGTPADTQSPPTFAMNIRTEVRMVISSVSRVSEEFKAP